VYTRYSVAGIGRRRITEEIREMERITESMLQAQIDLLNDLTGHSRKPWIRDDAGKLVAVPGVYILAGAYGGKQLQQMCNAGGGVRDITQGYRPRRQCFELLRAYIDGIEAGVFINSAREGKERTET
jgi:hypothetical protein